MIFSSAKFELFLLEVEDIQKGSNLCRNAKQQNSPEGQNTHHKQEVILIRTPTNLITQSIFKNPFPRKPN